MSRPGLRPRPHRHGRRKKTSPPKKVPRRNRTLPSYLVRGRSRDRRGACHGGRHTGLVGDASSFSESRQAPECRTGRVGLSLESKVSHRARERHFLEHGASPRDIGSLRRLRRLHSAPWRRSETRRATVCVRLRLPAFQPRSIRQRDAFCARETLQEAGRASDLSRASPSRKPSLRGAP